MNYQTMISILIIIVFSIAFSSHIIYSSIDSSKKHEEVLSTIKKEGHLTREVVKSQGKLTRESFDKNAIHD